MISPGAAAVISLFVPGLGQMCQGKLIRGLIWLVSVPLGYLAFIAPGVILHIACVVCAANYSKR